LKDKPVRVYISYDTWNDAKHTIRDGIVNKLSAAKQKLSIDKEQYCAGIIKYSEPEKTMGPSGVILIAVQK
jgi:hypothetical protein